MDCIVLGIRCELLYYLIYVTDGPTRLSKTEMSLTYLI